MYIFPRLDADFSPTARESTTPAPGQVLLFISHIKQTNLKTLLGSDCLAAGSQEVCLEGKRWGRGTGGLRRPETAGAGWPWRLATRLALRAGAVAPTAAAAQPAQAPAAPAIVVPRLLPCWSDSPLTSAPSTRGHLQPLAGILAGRASYLCSLRSLLRDPDTTRAAGPAAPGGSGLARPRGSPPRAAPSPGCALRSSLQAARGAGTGSGKGKSSRPRACAPPVRQPRVRQ